MWLKAAVLPATKDFSYGLKAAVSAGDAETSTRSFAGNQRRRSVFRS
jgi:hypothetical protein